MYAVLGSHGQGVVWLFFVLILVLEGGLQKLLLLAGPVIRWSLLIQITAIKTLMDCLPSCRKRRSRDTVLQGRKLEVRELS